MTSRFLTGAFIATSLLLSGCATSTNMAFENDAQQLTPASKPVYLMTATLKNTYKGRFQPRVLVVNVEKADAKTPADKLNFKMDSKGKLVEEDAEATGNSYLVRLELDPGDYEIRGLTSLGRAFPINALFFTPLHSPLKAGDAGVFYLGHVTATVRERQGLEFKAGPSIPLIDQGVAGASTGTFDIAISDEFATDEALFRGKFPALKDVAIKKAILPAFDRAKAQKWWEEN